MYRRGKIIILILIVLTSALFILDISVGAVDIPLHDVMAAFTGSDCPPVTVKIVMEIRLVKALTAIAAGAALAVSGLQMQTLFRNPLAGPYVLGISSGASLGVALFILGAPLLGASAIMQSVGITGSAWIGSALILVVISLLGHLSLIHI